MTDVSLISDPDFQGGHINEGFDVFVLGVGVRDVFDRLPRCGMVYTDSLSDEAFLTASGYRARYVYRDRGATFDRAAGLALDWLESLCARAREAGGDAELLFGDLALPVWALSYDALFEIKGGIFDSILNGVLAAEICAGSTEAVKVFASKDNQLGGTVVRFLADRARIEWCEPNFPKQPRTALQVLTRLWQRIDTLVIQSLLVGLRGFLELGSRHHQIALVGTSGDMARRGRDGRGRICVSDVYFENLEPAINAASPNILKVGINNPRLTTSGWKNTFLTWRMILSGAFRPWLAYASLKDIITVACERRRYRMALTAADGTPEFRAMFKAGGLDFYPQIRPRLFEMLPTLLASARFHHAVAERFLYKEKINLVISVESFSNIGRCLAAVLHLSGGQLWGIQCGIISPLRVTNVGFYVPALGTHKNLLADTFFTWGPAYSELLERFGISPARLRMMGFNKAKPLPEKKPSGQTKRIVYVTGGNALVCPYLMTNEEEDYTLDVLASCLPPEGELLVRTHPRHDAEVFRRRFAGLPKVRITAADEMPLEECLATADCIVGKASTVLLEAAQAGRQVLLINLAGTPDFTGFSVGETSLPCATDPVSLRTWLAKCLGQEEVDVKQKQAGFIASWCAGDAVGAASVLTAELLAHQVKKRE